MNFIIATASFTSLQDDLQAIMLQFNYTIIKRYVCLPQKKLYCHFKSLFHAINITLVKISFHIG
jgi:hypothetical protein